MPVVNRLHYLILNPVAWGFVTQSNWEHVHLVILVDIDENIVCRNLSIGVEASIGTVAADGTENFILHDSAICDYSDRLLARSPSR